jgi:D-serine deaminase-like pyridoxal phosphate-dependent protein
VDQVDTPALLLELPVARANIDLMAARIAGLPASLRPHVKAHKSVELARMQLDAGAVGVTTATVAEARAMVNAGIDDVLIANQVVTPGGIEAVAELAERAGIIVAVDDDSNLAALGAAAAGRGAEIGVLVELDVGMGRAGTRTEDEALALAQASALTSGVAFRGLMGYEGHCADEPDPARRTELTRTAMALLTSAADRVSATGIPIEIVSAGATGTFEVTGEVPGVTEVQAGSYVLMDAFHAPLVSGFGTALTVAATAVSVHGSSVVFDAGRKSIGADLRPPAAPTPGAELAFIHEEHVGFRFPVDAAPYRVGDRVRLVPGYAPTTVNLFGSYLVVQDDEVIDVWPVRARHGDR